MPKKPKQTGNPLGIDYSSLGKIQASDLTNNPALANAVLSYNATLEVQKRQLETEVETLKTYPAHYDKSKLLSRTAAGLNLIGTIFVGISTNLITSGQVLYGVIFGLPGVVLLIIGLIIVYFL